MNPIKTLMRTISMAGIGAIVATEPIWAGAQQAAAPAPLVGAGIPALMVFAGGYWALRRRRKG